MLSSGHSFRWSAELENMVDDKEMTCRVSVDDEEKVSGGRM